ncbi:MAG: cysteine peptidase family C39 domain-containing protein [Bacilli bacterium]|jgi:hypothetical protein|nr:cysteine peptidase family C39 domain-containing protein [Bacilli bacterium]MCI2111313.1 cysteine peptidase family C39 domain-containing protein [Bacilli bacterium]
MRIKTIRQPGEKGCGLAALRMLLVYLSHDRNYRFLTIEGHPPYSLELLSKAAQREGLRLEFRRALAPSAIRGADKLPMLVLLKRDGCEHMAVVERIDRRGIVLLDPAEGRRRVPFSDFEEAWTCLFGEIVSYKRKKVSCRKGKIQPVWPSFVSALIEFAANAALLFGFYFMNGKGSFLFPIGCFSAFGILTILRRFLSVRIMRKFDGRWLISTYDGDPSRFRENYVRYNSYKRDFLASPLDCCSAAFLLVALGFLVGANNPSFFIALGAVGVYEGVTASLFAWRLRKRRSALESMEDSLFAKALKPQEAFSKLARINDETYGIADRLGYSKIVFYVFCLAITFFCFLGQGTPSLNFYLFHFFGVLAAGEAFDRTFSFIFSEPEREGDEAYFREYFAKKADSE